MWNYSAQTLHFPVKIEAADAAKALAQTASISAMAESNAVSELSDAADGVRDTIQGQCYTIYPKTDFYNFYL